MNQFIFKFIKCLKMVQMSFAVLQSPNCGIKIAHFVQPKVQTPKIFNLWWEKQQFLKCVKPEPENVFICSWVIKCFGSKFKCSCQMEWEMTSGFSNFWTNKVILWTSNFTPPKPSIRAAVPVHEYYQTYGNESGCFRILKKSFYCFNEAFSRPLLAWRHKGLAT